MLIIIVATWVHCEIITPEDITQISRRVTGCGCQRIATWPDIPPFIYDTAKEFSSQYADYSISLELSSVLIYYKGGHEAQYKSYNIPTVVYGLSFKDGSTFNIEANSRTVLYYDIPFSVYINAFRMKYEQEPLTNADIFSKAIPLLDLYEVSSDLDDYEFMPIYTNKHGVTEDDNSLGTRCILTIMRSKEEHPFQCTNYIHLRVNRYTGQLLRLFYIPSLDRINEWCELVELKRKKEKEHEQQY